MSFLLSNAGDALRLAFEMFWTVLWPLALGFLLSAGVETFVSKQSISRLLGRDGVRSATLATAFGAASSSCSYAAVAVARTLFRKGATLPNSIIFEFASTNLVFELGLALLILLGWQFVAAEFVGGLVMVVLLAIVFRLTLSPRLTDAARTQADRGLLGKMEGHGAMDMSVTGGPLLARLTSPRALTSVSHSFFMNVYGLWWDLLLGFLIAGAIGAWVPETVWAHLFFSGHGVLPAVSSALIGPLVALLSYVCSVGNVPLAAVLWHNGIGFGGAVAFVFGCRVSLRGLVPDHGHGRSPRRRGVHGSQLGARQSQRRGVRNHHLMGCDDVLQYRGARGHRLAAAAISAHRRHRDAAHDGDARGADGASPSRLECSPRAGCRRLKIVTAGKRRQ
jgi:uncharacterized membrane protein YraQ (UPF0718 family)